MRHVGSLFTQMQHGALSQAVEVDEAFQVAKGLFFGLKQKLNERIKSTQPVVKKLSSGVKVTGIIKLMNVKHCSDTEHACNPGDRHCVKRDRSYQQRDFRRRDFH